jgi:hypothetical protein
MPELKGRLGMARVPLHGPVCDFVATFAAVTRTR